MNGWLFFWVEATATAASRRCRYHQARQVRVQVRETVPDPSLAKLDERWSSPGGTAAAHLRQGQIAVKPGILFVQDTPRLGRRLRCRRRDLKGHFSLLAMATVG